MPQFISQDLFDRLGFALILNSDPELTDPRSAAEVSHFLRETRAAFSEDDFVTELFQAARWLREWAAEIFGDNTRESFALVQHINERCLTHFPSGGRRPSHTSDLQPLAPHAGERLATFRANVAGYASQLEHTLAAAVVDF